LADKSLTVCLDTNVFFSAIAFGGKPGQVVQALLSEQFVHVTCKSIMEETRRNLSSKLGMEEALSRAVLNEIWSVSTIVEPTGTLKITQYAPDDRILETALMARCDVLVTGDKRHLLPLNPFQGLFIEPPADFLKRLEKLS
jgi:putative PIN family toxin of toxin-antitoxin system